MLTCKVCGQEVPDEHRLVSHYILDHELQVVSEEPLVLLITLPGYCTPGRVEAAEAFAKALAAVRKIYPCRKFSYTPFDMEKSKEFCGVKAWLVIGE